MFDLVLITSLTAKYVEPWFFHYTEPGDKLIQHYSKKLYFLIQNTKSSSKLSNMNSIILCKYNSMSPNLLC